MKNAIAEVLKDAKGLRLVAIGQPNDHLMDWRGCNNHFVALPGWKRGKRVADTPHNREILWALIRAVNSQRLDAAVKNKTGQFFSEYSLEYEMICKGVD